PFEVFRLRQFPTARRLCATILEFPMNNKFRTMAVVAALATLPASLAMAQACPPGYGFAGGVCQPIAGAAYAPSNPVSGALSGEAQGAASGAAAAGPVGAVVGGALGAATGTIAG